MTQTDTEINTKQSKLAEMQEATKDIPLPNVLRTVIAFDIAGNTYFLSLFIAFSDGTYITTTKIIQTWVLSVK